jgi:hypothetical protein
VLLFSELEDDRWETRKVEVFSDGHCGYADRNEEHAGTGLSIEPIPSLVEIAAQPQFEPYEISREEFELVWARRAGLGARTH